MDTQEQGSVHMCDFDVVQKGNYFEGESVRTEVEAKVRKHKNGKDEVTREMIKCSVDMVLHWIWTV